MTINDRLVLNQAGFCQFSAGLSNQRVVPGRPSRIGMVTPILAAKNRGRRIGSDRGSPVVEVGDTSNLYVIVMDIEPLIVEKLSGVNFEIHQDGIAERELAGGLVNCGGNVFHCFDEQRQRHRGNHAFVMFNFTVCGLDSADSAIRGQDFRYWLLKQNGAAVSAIRFAIRW